MDSITDGKTKLTQPLALSPLFGMMLAGLSKVAVEMRHPLFVGLSLLMIAKFF